MGKKTGRKRHGHYAEEAALHEIIGLKRRARKGYKDREGNPKPTPYAVIAFELNKEGYRTQTGKLWYGRIVKIILDRMANPAEEKQKRPTKRQLASTDYLSAAEIEKCRQACSGQNAVIFETLLRTGLRASELCSLEVRDLGLADEKRQIDVRRGKGCKMRAVFVGREICEILQAYIGPAAELTEAPLFWNERGRRLTYKNLLDRIKKIGWSADVKWVRPHKLRHSFSVISYNYKYNLEFLKDQLGHSSISTTAIYAKTQNKKKLQEMEDTDGLFGSPKPAVDC